jgi:DNA topoisomerase-3
VSASKKAQFKVVKDLLTKADTIIVATDSGREGSNIAWSIMNQAHIDVKSKKIKRLWLNSLEKDAIITGFKNLGDWHKDYLSCKEAQTRQISDWLIGMNGSPLYTLLLRQKGGARGVLNWSRADANLVYGLSKRPGNQKL